MATELTDAIAALDTLVGTIAGLNSEPGSVPTNYTSFPFYVIEFDTSSITKESAGSLRDMLIISLQIHFGLPATITPSDRTAVFTYYGLVKDILALDANTTLSDTVDTLLADSITVAYSLMYYRGIPTLGLEFSIPIKIRSVQSGSTFVKG